MGLNGYRAGVPDLDTGALLGIVAEPGKCRSIEAAAQRAMNVYGLSVGSFRVERMR